ncbi:MAG: molecular chaperone DnaK, partial [Actinomycetota bacterium]|nr:molecular chaperone DnaK [Actinomycetota bacterium]
VFTEALAEVGLHDVVLLTEPEAAAAAHAAAGRLPRGRTVAVYDLGGGTFDAAVVRGVHPTPVAPVGLTVLGRGQGIEALGGIDFDEALFWHVCAALGGAVDALDPADPATVRAVAGLRRACVAAKETLSVDTEAVVDVHLPNVTTRVRVTRGEFEDMISPALRQTVDVLGEVVDAAGLRLRADLDGVLLVGGSSRIPLVARMLSAELGRPVAVDPDPTTVVARGATWAAAAASGAVRPAAPVSGPFRAPVSAPFPTPVPATATASAPFPTPVPATASASWGTRGSGPVAAVPPADDSPRTDVLGRDMTPVGRTDADPMTMPVGPALRSAPGSLTPEPITSPLRIPPVHRTTPATGTAGASPFAPPRPDPRRRRLAMGASAAAVLVVAGGVAVAVPLVTTSNSTATVAAPAPGAPAGITAQPAAADAGTLPTGTLPSASDPTTSQASSRARAARVTNKAATEAATPAARPGAVAKHLVPAAAAPVAPPAPAPVATAPAPVVTPPASTTPATTDTGTPKSGTGTTPPVTNPGTGSTGGGTGTTTTTPPAGTAPAATGPSV